MADLEKLNVVDENGNKIEISLLGMFEIPDLEKKYIMYGLINEDESLQNGGVLLGEVVEDGDDIQVLGILPEEKDMVVAYYNEISKQLGEEDDGE